MNTERRGHLVLYQKLGGAHIRRQHAFLDELVCVVALQWHDALDLALRVVDDFGFRQLEIHGAARMTRLVENLVERVEILQMRDERRIFLAQRRVLVHQHGRHLRIGEPRLRAH